MSRKTKNNFYAVARGRRPGIYTAWYGSDGAEAQVKGYSGAVFQGFATRDEARGFLQRMAANIPAKTASDPAAKPIPMVKAAADPVIIYTDGGCFDNPGRGGYGVVIKTRHPTRTKELSGGYRRTTNNRMELMACIVGLRELKKPSKVILYSDSQYVVNGMAKGWARRWRANAWMRNKVEKALNADLWDQLLRLCDRHDVTFRWVKGHAGIEANERCDQLANMAMNAKHLPPDVVYEGSR